MENYPDLTTPVPDCVGQECAIQTMASDSDRPDEGPPPVAAHPIIHEHANDKSSSSSDSSEPWVPPWEYRTIQPKQTANCLNQTFQMVPIHDIDEEMRLHYFVDDAPPDGSVDGDDDTVEHTNTNAVGPNEVPSKAQWKALTDRGANKGIAGNDSKAVTKTEHINLCGLDVAAPEQTDRCLTMSARRRAHAAKHYLPPSQCQLEDLEFDFRPCTSEDFRPYSSDDSEASESSTANPNVYSPAKIL